MKKKSFLAGILAAALCTSALLAVPAAAADGNYTDTGYYFSFSENSNQDTIGRRKYTDSSLYVYVAELPWNGFQVFANGRNGEWLQYFDCTYKKSYINNRGEYSLRNYVYERGFPYASLGGYTVGAFQDAIGLWSPDCFGDFPYI